MDKPAERERLLESRADTVKLGVCYALGALSLAYCFYAACTEGKEHAVQVLICILGGAVGWCVGMYLTPSSEGETKKFSEFGKIILLVGAGIGIGKAQDLYELLEPVLGGDVGDVSALRVLLFICTLLIFGQATYVGRLHVRGAEDKGRQRREKLLAEVRERLDQLSGA